MRYAAIVSAATLLSTLSVCSAEVLFDSLTPTATGDLLYDEATGGQRMGQQFRTGSGAVTLSELKLAIGNGSNYPFASAWVMTNDSDLNVPAAEVGTIFAMQPIVAEANTTLDFTGLNISLAANTKYWVVLESVYSLGTSGSIFLGYNNNAVSTPVNSDVYSPQPLDNGKWFAGNVSTPYSTNPYAMILTVPEPTLGLVAVGGALALGMRRKRAAAR